MILIYILSPLLSWLLLYYLLWSSIKRALFEKIAISYIVWLSLYVLLISLVALVLWWTIVYEISYWVLILLIALSIWKKYPFRNIIHDIQKWFWELKVAYKHSSWTSRIVWLALIMYCLCKISMSFIITTSRLTYDEDAVAAWDVKSKVFTFQKSLILDWTSKEFLGTAPSRIIYWPIVDAVLVWTDPVYFDLYSNVISPIIYIILWFFAVWYIYRKTRSIWFGLLSWYLSLSLPFIFYQSVWSYWNLPFGVGVVMFSVYMTEYISSLHNGKIAWWEIFVLALLWFWISAVRNEGIYYMGIIVFITAINYFHSLRKLPVGKLFAMLVWPISLWIVWYIWYKIMLSFEQLSGAAAHLDQIASGNILSRLFENMSSQPVFKELFAQMFYHPDYSFVLIVMILLSAIWFWFYKNSENRVHLLQFIALFLITVVVLFSNLELWLLTHYVFIRYALSFIFFVPLIVVWLIDYIHQRHIKS